MAARELAFPKTRHLALGADARLLDLAAAEEEAARVPPAGIPLPPPVQKGAPGTPDMGALPAAAPVEGLQAGVEPSPSVVARVVRVDLSVPPPACAALDGSPAPVRCASSAEGREHAAAQARRAAALGEAVLLEGLDRWYRLGPEGAGGCRSCELALSEALRESFGEHLQPFDALAPLRASAAPLRERPFGVQREALRLREHLEATKRAVLAGRDAARRERSLEMALLGRVGPLSGAALLLCQHLDGLVFELPSADPLDAFLPLLLARAALGQRPAVAALPPGASPGQVRQLAALATACDCDVLLDPQAGAEAQAALEAHRAFVAVTRERFRPVQPLVDVALVFSPGCDHLTGGAHLRATAAAAAALTRAQLLAGVRLELSHGVRAQLAVVAGGAALSQADAAALRRHVEGGGDVLLAGRCATVDDEGRAGELVFPEVKSGLERVGEGRVFAVEDEADPSRALRELWGRARAQLSVAGRGRLLLRAYLDPERKLDVHLVNLDLKDGAFTPAQGMQLILAGEAAGGGRTGYWFAPGRESGRDGERIALNPSGFSVSTILPAVESYALLAVPR